jgi:excisionase family DNA binding protein
VKEATNLMNKTAKEELLTAKEASAYLKVVPRTLYRHIRKHQIPALQLGREWRFIKSDLDKWLMKRLQESSAESKHVHPTTLHSKRNPNMPEFRT